ncbi:MAG: adenylosuccinate synthetase [Butyrivibrio sp.]|nr:adenylosuccinate synthetase [Butyrivibrio sp.]
MSPRVYVVIGKNFGDEGKGRVVDDLACKAKSLVIRHNGGAQSGHTVIRRAFQNSEASSDGAQEARFIFHELGAGSFTGADTLWAETFYPDLYKLNEEYAAFYALSGIKSSIFSMPETPITTIDDVLLNMALERSRGDGRHGSCGMGIYEAYLRSQAGYGITVADVKRGGVKELYELLKRNRKEYVLPRVRQLAADSEDYLDLDKCTEIMDLLEDDNVLWNAAVEICDAAGKIVLIDNVRGFLEKYDRVIFETGQGLLLDSENKEYAPHVTGSRTGLTNPAAFAGKAGINIDEVVYVTRSYVTRHGAGLLKHECSREELGIENPDSTNVTNEWQGDFRYAPHSSIEEFLEAPCRDLEEFLEALHCDHKECRHRPKVSLAITHLSDTSDDLLFAKGAMPVESFCKAPETESFFDAIYLYD